MASKEASMYDMGDTPRSLLSASRFFRTIGYVFEVAAAIGALSSLNTGTYKDLEYDQARTMEALGLTAGIGAVVASGLMAIREANITQAQAFALQAHHDEQANIARRNEPLDEIRVELLCIGESLEEIAEQGAPGQPDDWRRHSYYL